MKTNIRKRTEHKRHGTHHRRGRDYKKVYWPYLPLVLSIALSFIVSHVTPRTSTLAYATNTSIQGLLSATNSHRSNNGAASLTLNSKLNNAAQAKANDMVTRNYWSHNTPDGQEPWVFVKDAGYSYQKAGENLAYGFLTSDSTVSGWMNSPSHKDNMLDTAFLEVGFGFANSADYNNSGEQTVVVAMYGRPQTLGSSQAEPTPPSSTAQSKPVAKPTAPETEPAPPPEPVPADTVTESAENVVNTEAPVTEPEETPVSRAQALTGGNAPWATFGVGILLGGSVASVLLKHGLALRRLLRNSERFVLHHPLFDSTVLGLIILGITLSQTVGFIR